MANSPDCRALYYFHAAAAKPYFKLSGLKQNKFTILDSASQKSEAHQQGIASFERLPTLLSSWPHSLSSKQTMI